MTPSALSAEQKRELRSLSAQLLHLHKLLLNDQRATYERLHGPVASTGQMLGLVLEHPDFAWLRQLSGVIVEIDEIVAPRSTAGSTEVEAARERVRALLIPSDSGNAFQTNFADALKSLPELRTIHDQVVSALGPGA